jgi:hypothetical protein
MGNQLFGGTKNDTTDSLALYIENAFNNVRSEYGLDPMPNEGKDDRMMLFLGIAQGVVDYLRDFTEAFVVESHQTGFGTDPSRHDNDEDGHVSIRVKP